MDFKLLKQHFVGVILQTTLLRILDQSIDISNLIITLWTNATIDSVTT